MKNLHSCCLIVCAACFFSCDRPGTLIVDPGKGQWEVVRQPEDQTRYYDIYFADLLHGWVVGESGHILVTADGGTTWRSQSSGTGSSLHSVYFADAQAGWAAGSHGTILHTMNGGNSWTSQAVPVDTSRGFLTIHFADAAVGWAGSNYGEIMHTTNGGATWTSQESGTQWAITSLFFLDRMKGWALAINGIVLHTVDAGTHWGTQGMSNVPPANLTDIWFTDQSTGWVATTTAASSTMQTSSPVLSTTNAGLTWVVQGHVPSLHTTSVHFITRTIGWAAGMGGIYYTRDAGTHWAIQYIGEVEPIEGLSFVGKSNGWAIGFRGTIMRYNIE